jgi:hypothetical protein
MSPAAVSLMTCRERVLAAIATREVDHVPCSPFFNPLTAKQREGRTWNFPWPESGEGRIEYLVKELGVDPVVGVGIPGPGACPDEGVGARAWKEGNVLHKVWSTPSGDLHASIRQDDKWPYGDDIPLHHDFIAHYVEPWLETEKDLACLRHLLQPPRTKDQLERTRRDVGRAKAAAEQWRLATMAQIGMGLTGAQQLCGAKQICLLTVDNPELVDEYLELEHQLNLRRIEIAMDLGVEIVRRNGYYETCDFYSPAMLERFLGDRLRKEAQAVHQGGGLINYTLHTGIMPMLDYVASLGMDGLFGLDIAFKDTDLRAVREKLSGKCSFWTGPSNTYHMWAEDPEDVRQAVRDVFAAFGKSGLLITPCPSSHSIMPWRNMLAMVEEWKRLR